MKNLKLTQKAKKKLIKRFVIAGTIAAIAIDYFTVSNSTNTKSHNHEYYNHLSNVHVVTVNKEYLENDTVLFFFDDGSLASCATENKEEVNISIPTECKYVSTTAMNKGEKFKCDLPYLEEEKEYNLIIDCKTQNVDVVSDNRYEYEKEKEKERKNKLIKLPGYRYGVGQTSFSYNNMDLSDVCEDHFRIQGVCRVDDYLYVSAHHDKKLYPFEKEKNSRIYIYDIYTSKLVNFLSLDNKDHLGGIIYNYRDNTLLLSSSNGKATSYNLVILNRIIDNFNKVNQEIGKKQKEIDFDTDQLPIESVLVNNDIDVSKITHEGRNSTMSYSNDSIYVATYDNAGGGEIIKYNNSLNFNDYEKYDTDICYIQGIAAIKYNNSEYIITSSSLPMGGTDFIVQKVNNDNKGNKTLQKVAYHHISKNGGEGIFIDNKKNVVCVFEGGIFGGNSGDVYSISFEELLTKGIDDYQFSNYFREFADYLNTNYGPSVDKHIKTIKNL